MGTLFWAAWFGAFAAGGWFVLIVQCVVLFLIWWRIWREK